MYKQIAEKISNLLASSGSILDSEVSVYSYAAELFLSSITGLAICMSIGFILGVPFGSLLFLLVYCPLRQFSGGYHASNHISCGTIFCIIFLQTALIDKYLIVDSFIASVIFMIIAGMGTLVIIVTSPIEDRNKRLSKIERVKYKKISASLGFVGLCLIALFVKLQMFEASYYVCSAILILSILLIAGKLKNLKGEKNETFICESHAINGSSTDDTCYGFSK